MKFTLYKIDNNGRLREWTMEIDPANGQYRAITGIYLGNLVTNAWTKVSQKNVGRANETSLDQQALLEAQSIIADKKHEGYVESIDEAYRFVKPFEPMLAHKWEKFDQKCLSQPKLDGIRCNISKTSLLSRNAKHILAVPHIREFFDKFVFNDNNYSDLIFDGELYNHEYKDDFNSITSIVRKTKNISEEDLHLSKDKIQYHVYDVFSKNSPELPTFTRIEMIKSIFSENIGPVVIVPTELCSTQFELDQLNANYLADGYEGQMVRAPIEPYEQKRSKHLLKRKPLYDTGGVEKEYEIVEIVEGQGNWAGKAKVVVCKIGDKTFSATIKGNMENGIKILRDKESYIGKLATVVCQNLTPDGIPRFPIATDLGREDV